MTIFSLFELFLTVFSLYAILRFQGQMRILVPLLGLFGVLLCERLQKRLKEEKEAKKRLLKYKLEEHRKKE